jgi:hypothetical protein
MTPTRPDLDNLARLRAELAAERDARRATRW